MVMMLVMTSKYNSGDGDGCNYDGDDDGDDGDGDGDGVYGGGDDEGCSGGDKTFSNLVNISG